MRLLSWRYSSCSGAPTINTLNVRQMLCRAGARLVCWGNYLNLLHAVVLIVNMLYVQMEMIP